MAFDMDEFGASEDEGTGEVSDPRAVAGVPGSGRPGVGPAQSARSAPLPQNEPIVPNAAEIVAKMLGQRPPAPHEEPQTVQEAMEVANDEYMNEVVDRLDVAAHYQLLLKDTFFQTNTRAAVRVTNELRAWVRERLAELVGMNTTKKLQLSDETIKVLSEFTPAEIYALKSVASKLIAGGFTAPASSAPVAPQVQKVVPAAPALVKRGPAQQPAAAQSPAPQPQPTEQEPPRRGPGRPPGARNKRATNPNKIKFPGSNAEMSAATYMVSAKQTEETVNKNPLANVAMAIPGK